MDQTDLAFRIERQNEALIQLIEVRDQINFVLLNCRTVCWKEQGLERLIPRFDTAMQSLCSSRYISHIQRVTRRYMRVCVVFKNGVLFINIKPSNNSGATWSTAKMAPFKIIGAGYGRTGTTSLASAVETLE